MLVVYYRRHELLPGYEPWVRAATVAILIIVGSAGSHWLVRWLSPRLGSLFAGIVLQSTRPFRVGERVRFAGEASPRQVEERLLGAIRVPTRYPPSVALEEVDEDGVVLRISATPLRPDDGSQLAEEVLAAVRPMPARVQSA